MPTQQAPADEVLALCRAQGFALAGVAPVGPSARDQAFREWLGVGRHGEMAWLADTVEDRLDPARLLPGARAVVMVADLYAARGQTPEAPTPGAGRIARYARGRDYHDTIKRRLHRVCDTLRDRRPGTKTRAFCDTAPVQERELAAACGIGWIGKHTLVIHPTHGSWLVLGGFLTTLALEPPVSQATTPDHCGSCTRCIDACPTGAITPYSVDASRCISYLTIEHQSPIGEALGEELGGWFVGCDICQEVCPHNSARSGGGAATPRAEYAPRRSQFDLLEVLGWDEPTRRGRFATSAMKRITLAQAKRNAVLLLAREASGGDRDGSRTDRLVRRLHEIAWDPAEDDMVRAAARSALGRIERA